MVAESRAVSQAWSSASISMTPHLLRASPRWAAGRLDVDSDCSFLSRLRGHDEPDTPARGEFSAAACRDCARGQFAAIEAAPCWRVSFATSDEARSDRGYAADGLYEKSDVEVPMRHAVGVGVLRDGSGSIPSSSEVMCAQVREPRGPGFVPGPGPSRLGNRRARSALQRSAARAARRERVFQPNRALVLAAELRQATESLTAPFLSSSSSAGVGSSRHRGPSADLLVAPSRPSGAVSAGAHAHTASDARPR